MSLDDDVSSLRQRGPRQNAELDQSGAQQTGKQNLTEKDQIYQINWALTFSMAAIPILLAVAALSILVPSSFGKCT